MKTKQLFNLALLSRLTSLLCLGIFFYCHITELDTRVVVLALGFSFTGWIIGSFWLGMFNAAQAVAMEKELEAVIGATLEVKEVTDEEEKSSHPLFKDDDNE